MEKKCGNILTTLTIADLYGKTETRKDLYQQAKNFFFLCIIHHQMENFNKNHDTVTLYAESSRFQKL